MTLDLGSLKKALSSLESALQVASPDSMSMQNKKAQDVIKAGVIQNFEFTYELCWKFMTRWLESNMGATYVEGVTRRELFRRAVENRLIADVDDWMEYHDARNETSHTYDADKAEEIFQVSQNFFPDAKHLLEALEQRND
ncbi:MAG: nucleotidyltransferase substrate binding protein [bacterium]